MPSTSLLPAFLTLFLLSPFAKGGMYKGQGAAFNLAEFGGQLPQGIRIVRVTNTVAVPVPVPFPVEKHIPFPISVTKPMPYAVPQPFPLEVTKPFVIQQAVPVEIPKLYTLPQMFTYRPNPSMAVPAEHLTVPQYNPGQNDFQAYINYGSGNSGSIYGNGNGGSADISTSGYQMSNQMNYNQEQSFMSQQGYGTGDQGYKGHSLQLDSGYGFQPNVQGGFTPSGQDFMMTEEPGYSQGGNEYSQATGYNLMLGQHFESTNSVDEQGSMRGSY